MVGQLQADPLGVTKIGTWECVPHLGASPIVYMSSFLIYDDNGRWWDVSRTALLNVESATDISLQHIVTGATIHADLEYNFVTLTIEEI
jgi:hypothetical protein